MRLRHLHTSGRFNVKPATYERWLDTYMRDTDLITATEVDNNLRARCLREPGWGTVYGDHGPRDDCGIAWRKNTCHQVYADTLPLSAHRYHNDRGWITGQTYGAFAVLDTSGGRLAVGVMHTPHGMQADLRAHDDQPRTEVGKAYQAITEAAVGRLDRVATKFHADAVLLAADWNLNLRAAWVRAWFRDYLDGTGLRLNFKPPYPARGTHGREVIDAAVYRGMTLVAGPTLRPHDPSSDHVAWAETFRLSAPKEN